MPEWLLADEARPPNGTVDGGRAIACACFPVGLTMLRGTVLSEGLTTMNGIVTNRGSRVPELRRILRDTHESVA